MSDQDICRDKDALLAVLYDEGNEAERQRAAAHVATCEACGRELADLRGIRETLARWTPPARHLGFRIVRDPGLVPDRRPWWTRPIPVWAQAAAAVLLLSVGAAVANLDIRYGRDGLAVRTGWAPQTTPEVRAEAAADPAPPWKIDLAALEERLRADLVPPQPVAGQVAPAAPQVDQTQVLREFRALVASAVAASEERMRREVAVRNLQLARDLRLDLAQVQRGLVQLDGRSGAEAAQNREILNRLMRVSQIK